MVRRYVWLGGIALTLGFTQAAWAGRATYPYPSPCPNVCVPNVAEFGYFRTTWRQWPGEPRPAQTNPRSVGLEVLPTPQGQEYVPSPPAAPSKAPAEVPEGQVLPPGGAILPPQEPPAGAKPETPSEGVLPGLPGLPVEPGQEPPPGLPNVVPPKDTPNPKEQPAPNDTPKPSADKSSSGAQREETGEHATAAIPWERREVQRGTVVMLIDSQDSSEKRATSTTHRADSIAATMPTAPTDNVEAAAYATVESARSAGSDSANGVVPPVALGGYCPVALTNDGRWTPGDLRWTVVHNGWIYRLSGPAERRQFMANPDAFAPAYSGNDPVLAVEQQRAVPGQVAYCATYNGRLYMFSSAATQSQFNKDPQRYAIGK